MSDYPMHIFAESPESRAIREARAAELAARDAAHAAAMADGTGLNLSRIESDVRYDVALTRRAINAALRVLRSADMRAHSSYGCNLGRMERDGAPYVPLCVYQREALDFVLRNTAPKHLPNAARDAVIDAARKVRP